MDNNKRVFATQYEEKGYLVVSCFTMNTQYEQEVKNLEESLKEFKLSYYIEGYDSLGSWLRNIQYKANFIRDCLHKFKKDILFLDADAVVVAYPKLFDDMQHDVAVYYRFDRNLISNTLYLKYNSKVLQLVDDWIIMTSQNKDLFDQDNLQLAIRDWPEGRASLSVLKLPAEYAKIFDSSDTDRPSVIEQFQASRRFKKEIDRK